jgi:hypothetical protein
MDVAWNRIADLRQQPSADVLYSTYTQNGTIKARVLADFSWVHVLINLPLSDKIFVAGSAATWLAERTLCRSTPLWSPNDIDVFMCLSPSMYDTQVSAFQKLYNLSSDAISRRLDIADLMIPSGQIVSFIRCSVDWGAQEVISQFDINICTPFIVREADGIWVSMTMEVAASIREREMRCTIRKRNALFLQYPLQKSLNRMRKYVARGYTFVALIFESTSHMDFPEHDAEVELKISDFDHAVINPIASIAKPRFPSKALVMRTE